MPTITLGQQSVDFGVCAPGPQSSVLVSFQITSDQPFTGLMEMSTSPNSGFVATETLIFGMIAGMTPPPSDSATTSGAPGTTNVFNYTPSKTLPNTFSAIRIDFSPPASPMPADWSGIVSFSWFDPLVSKPVQLAQLSLTGTTSQLEMRGTDANPIVLTPGKSAMIPLQLEYDSLDPAPISVTVGASEFSEYPEPAGLTIPNGKPVSMPATYVFPLPSGKNPNPNSGTSSGTTPVSMGGGLTPVLNPHRIVNFSLQVKASNTIKPGKNQTAYVGFAAPALPEEIGGPRSYPVLFDIPPLPISISVVPSQPITVIRGRSVTVPINIADSGISTNLNFKAVTGHSNITISPSSIPIGQGDTDINLKIAVADDETVAGVELVTIGIPWTANDGLSTATLNIQLNILPGVKIFSTGHLSNGDLSGTAWWTLHQDGSCTFMGTVHSSSYDTYTFAVLSTVAENVGSMQAFIGAAASGGINNNNAAFNTSGSSRGISDAWEEFLDAGVTFKLSASNNIGDAIGAFFGAVGTIILAFGIWVTGGGDQQRITPDKPTPS